MSMVYYIDKGKENNMIEVVLNESGRFDVYRDDEVVASLPYEKYDEKLLRAVNSLMESAEVERQIIAIKTLLGDVK